LKRGRPGTELKKSQDLNALKFLASGKNSERGGGEPNLKNGFFLPQTEKVTNRGRENVQVEKTLGFSCFLLKKWGQVRYTGAEWVVTGLSGGCCGRERGEVGENARSSSVPG